MDSLEDGWVDAVEGTELTKQVVGQLQGQHAIHGLIGRVFERIGGEDRMVTWADENPGRFFSMMVATTPNLTPVSTIQGDVNLVVHQALAPTDLDGEYEVKKD